MGPAIYIYALPTLVKTLLYFSVMSVLYGPRVPVVVSAVEKATFGSSVNAQ